MFVFIPHLRRSVSPWFATACPEFFGKGSGFRSIVSTKADVGK